MEMGTGTGMGTGRGMGMGTGRATAMRDANPPSHDEIVTIRQVAERSPVPAPSAAAIATPATPGPAAPRPAAVPQGTAAPGGPEDDAGSTDPGPGSGARAAAAFFRRQEAWRGILTAARETCARLGRVGGTVAIAAADEAAWWALASLLGRDPRIPRRRRLVPPTQRREAQPEAVRVALAELDRALRRSRFRCGLLEALEAYFAEPVESRPQRRARELGSWQDFLREAEGWFTSEPARRWWEGVARGEAPGARQVRRDWNRGGDSRAALRRAVWHVARALNELPALQGRPEGPERSSRSSTTPWGATGSAPMAPPSAEPLALFAHRVCGDPHALDPDTPAGRLLLQALTVVLPEAGDLGRGLTSPALRRNVLLEAAGLAADDTSSTVAAFHLRAVLPDPRRAPPRDGSPRPVEAGGAANRDPGWIEDPVAAAACATGTVVVWPLREIRRRPRFFAAGGAAYAVENPQVFQALVDTLVRRREANLSDDEGGPRGGPSLLCTSGRLSLAAVLLLDRLIGRTGPGTPAPHQPARHRATGSDPRLGAGPGPCPERARLYYSGDFDVAGLEIAYSVITRYGAAACPWRMTAADYRHALAATAGDAGARRFDPGERRRLERLRARGFLPELIDEMLAVGHPAYQEGLIDRLLADLLAAVHAGMAIPHPHP
ncbi:protein of unknown function DUF2399,protein of unknown function DUF3323 [Thermaerobacter subterraneus DSM 13965]|uniref:TIGR02679 family protein n=2 Tax=Thermaerobacter TaxID=73918 RepID=K6QER1_9FIRM|nr:protein of unknown function DUF2399,protein of unknown function DUF3323 [Thermaerobacter subterraneus DSM 13965]